MSEFEGSRSPEPGRRPDSACLPQTATLLRVLADDERMLLALLLAEHPRTPQELARAAELPGRRVDAHMAELRGAGAALSVGSGSGHAALYDLCCEDLRSALRRRRG